MSTIMNKQSGVQSQCRTIDAWAREIEQSAFTFLSKADGSLSGLDGVAQSEMQNFNRITTQSVETACKTAQNLRMFLENTSQALTDLDKEQSVMFEQGGAS